MYATHSKLSGFVSFSYQNHGGFATTKYMFLFDPLISGGAKLCLVFAHLEVLLC